MAKRREWRVRRKSSAASRQKDERSESTESRAQRAATNMSAGSPLKGDGQKDERSESAVKVERSEPPQTASPLKGERIELAKT